MVLVKQVKQFSEAPMSIYQLKCIAFHLLKIFPNKWKIEVFKRWQIQN